MSDQSMAERSVGPDVLRSSPQQAERFDPLAFRSAAMSPIAADELAMRVQRLLAPVKQGRRKIWDFDTKLHCSIIGTCLTTAELRQVLLKLTRQEAATANEHNLHASGVLVAGSHRDGAKLLHKALDRRHRLAINQFDRARTAAEVRARWQEALERGEVPGAYWAALTHPATNDALVREIFAEVHMLSHLVGAANRADIRRLRQLENENARLQAKVERQQRQLRDAIVSRDNLIRQLQRALEMRVAHDHDGQADTPTTLEEAGWESLAADLTARLTRSEGRRVVVEQQLGETRTALSAERNARIAIEKREGALLDEIGALEASLTAEDDGEQTIGQGAGLAGRTLLYVGGRPGQIVHLRAEAQRQGAMLLHHDGGIEERGGLLPGLVSRADIVLFPVDCVSHAAMSLVKRLCRQAGKPFMPLRSGGLAPFCAVVQNAAFNGGDGV
jgi:hypothetical protein